jgi:hypothetical protein
VFPAARDSRRGRSADAGRVRPDLAFSSPIPLPAGGKNEENAMTLGTILLIVLILLLIGALPSWGYSRSWGYGPTGGLGLIVLIVVVLLVMGKI